MNFHFVALQVFLCDSIKLGPNSPIGTHQWHALFILQTQGNSHSPPAKTPGSTSEQFHKACLLYTLFFSASVFQ